MGIYPSPRRNLKKRRHPYQSSRSSSTIEQRPDKDSLSGRCLRFSISQYYGILRLRDLQQDFNGGLEKIPDAPLKDGRHGTIHQPVVIGQGYPHDFPPAHRAVL